MNDAGAPSLVTIVLTTLNGARFLRESIDSCLGQSHQEIELIIVDGGSTDGTLDIIASYEGDARIRLIHQEGNAGKLPGAINLGLDAARGSYLTWTQDDCRYEPQALSRMVEVLEARPDIGQVYADYWEIDADGRVIARHEPCEPDQILSAPDDPLGVCFLIRRAVRDAVGSHDPASYPCQDFDYRIRIARQHQSHHLHEPLYSWRSHGDSLTGRLGWPTLARKDVEIRQRHGLLTKPQVSRELAAIDAAEAFERYHAADWRAVPAAALNAVRRQPGYLTNRGIWSITARSLWRSLSARPPTAPGNGA